MRPISKQSPRQLRRTINTLLLALAESPTGPCAFGGACTKPALGGECEDYYRIDRCWRRAIESKEDWPEIEKRLRSGSCL